MRVSRRLVSALAFYAAAATALVFLYRDAYSQDGALHFLLARWAWRRPITFVEIWARPGFTFLYSFPAQIGYPAAKLFTVAVTAAAAWQTARGAEALKLDRSWLAAPILLASPVLFLLSTETMTEPLFALVFATALRLHYGGRPVVAFAVASFLPTLRPEGLLLCAVWGLCSLRKFPRLLWLGLGTALWIAAAWILSGDPVYLLHHFPWMVRSGGSSDAIRILRYPAVLPLSVGPFLLPFALAGAVLLWRERCRFPLVLIGAALGFFVLSTWLVVDAGVRSRFLAPVMPAIALLVLRGWNAVSARGWMPRTAAAVLMALSFGFAFGAVDLSPTNRDWKAFRGSIAAARESGHVARTERLVAAQMYAYVELDRTPGELPFERSRRAGNLTRIGDLPSGTLVLWDDLFGPWYFGIDAADFAAAGFRLVAVREYDLPPLAPWPGFLQDWTGRRRVRIATLFRETSR